MKSAEITAQGGMATDASVWLWQVGSKHSVDLVAVNGWSVHVSSRLPCTRPSGFYCLQAEQKWKYGDRLFHKKADDLKILESAFDLESSICCLSISLPKMSISLVNFFLANKETLGHFFGSSLFISSE